MDSRVGALRSMRDGGAGTYVRVYVFDGCFVYEDLEWVRANVIKRQVLSS